MKFFLTVYCFFSLSFLFGQKMDSITVEISNKDTTLTLHSPVYNVGDTSISVKITSGTKSTVPVTLNGKPLVEIPDTSACLSFSVYSDLIGIDNSQPNGLVQTEGYWSTSTNLWIESPSRIKSVRERKDLMVDYRKAKRNDIYSRKKQYKSLLSKKPSFKERINGATSDESWRNARKDKTDDIGKIKREFRNNKQSAWNEQRNKINIPSSEEEWQFGFGKNVVVPILTISKIDGKDRFKQVIYHDTIFINDTSATKERYIHTFDLIKYSTFSCTGKINIIYFHFGRRGINLYGDFYFGVYGSGVKDTTLSKDNFYVYSKAFGWNVRVSTHVRKKVNIEAWMTSFYLTLMSNDIIQKSERLYFPESNPKNNIINASDFSDRGRIPVAERNVWIIGTQIVVTPDLDKPSNKIFLRISFYTNAFILGDQAIEGNNFSQFQIGYRKSIDIRNLGK